MKVGSSYLLNKYLEIIFKGLWLVMWASFQFDFSESFCYRLSTSIIIREITESFFHENRIRKNWRIFLPKKAFTKIYGAISIRNNELFSPNDCRREIMDAIEVQI